MVLNKRLLLLVFVFLIGLVSVNAFEYEYNSPTLTCYQETANVSTACGGLATGSYSDDAVGFVEWRDGSFATSSLRAGFVNYTKHPDAYGFKWLTGSFGEAVSNVTNQSCYDYNPSSLILWVNTTVTGGFPKWMCNNGSWITLKSEGAVAPVEEGVYWLLNDTIVYNFTNSTGVFGETSNFYFNLTKNQVYDEFSNPALVINGVSYASTQVDPCSHVGNVCGYVVTGVPDNVLGVNSFYWNVSFNDSTVFNFYTVNGSHVVYGNNLTIYLFNETNGANLSGVTVTTLLNNGVTQTSNTSTSGIALFTNLSSDTYTITSSATGYDTKSYQVTVNSTNNNTLNAYLLQTTTNLAVFTIVDDDTGQSLPNAEVVIYRWVNNVKTQVADVFSDVTGKVQQEYSDNTRYDYEVSLTGYETKTFTLNPIIYTTYTIRLTPTFSTVDDTDFGSVSIAWSPKQFYNGNVYNISFTFNNPNGNLETYGFNASFNGSSCADSDTTSTGATITCSLNVTNPSYSIYDYVYISYYYKLDYGDLHSYTLKYPVINQGALTWANNIERDYGLGVFEKTFIGTIISIILTGAGAMFVGVTGAGLMYLASLYLVVKLGLMTYQLVLVSAFAAIIITAWRMNQ